MFSPGNIELAVIGACRYAHGQRFVAFEPNSVQDLCDSSSGWSTIQPLFLRSVHLERRFHPNRPPGTSMPAQPSIRVAGVPDVLPGSTTAKQ